MRSVVQLQSDVVVVGPLFGVDHGEPHVIFSEHCQVGGLGDEYVWESNILTYI